RQPEAAHQRPASVDEGPDQNLDQQMEVIFLRGRKAVTNDNGNEEQQRKADDGSGRNPDHDLPPNRPCGRMKITTMKNRNAIAYPHSVAKHEPPTVMNSEMMKAAMKPPIMLPTPPSPQIMKING